MTIFTFNLPSHRNHIHIAKYLFSIRDDWYKNLGDNWVLARKMFSSGCRPRLKNAVPKFPTKLRLQAEILSQWVNGVIFPRSNPLRSNRSVLNLSNDGLWNPKRTLKINDLWIELKAQNFVS